jgi:exodeoxyribonuclease VII small subunit
MVLCRGRGVAKQQRETFEILYQRLEESVAKLEAGNLPLEESIALFEEGMMLARRCQELLDSAELRISRLKESVTTDLSGTAEAPGEDEEFRDTEIDEDV